MTVTFESAQDHLLRWLGVVFGVSARWLRGAVLDALVRLPFGVSQAELNATCWQRWVQGGQQDQEPAEPGIRTVASDPESSCDQSPSRSSLARAAAGNRLSIAATASGLDVATSISS
jgi:hypothetical protein